MSGYICNNVRSYEPFQVGNMINKGDTGERCSTSMSFPNMRSDSDEANQNLHEIE